MNNPQKSRLTKLYAQLNETIIPAVINSYAVIFFLNNRWMALAVFISSFLNFYAGLSGFIAVVLTAFLANSLGFDKTQLRNGVLTFNALITGIGLGTFFDPGIVFFTLLALTSMLTLILSVAMGGWLFKYGLPFLSIPFVFGFWFVVLPSSMYENLGLTHRNIFWINEMYSIGGNPLLSVFQAIESWEINKLLEIYLRSLSSIFFQDNLISGIIIAVALLISSRIFFSLSVLGFLSAYLFAQFSGSEAASITYYNIGANFIMVAIAIGGFFIIPSKCSYFWTILLVPLTSIVLIFFTKLFGFIQLPVFSLPYALVTILFVHFLRQRATEKKLILTPLQHYSPETNLYAYLNNRERLNRFLYLPIQLPFWGTWKVTQGYAGEFTHKGAWAHALDFMIEDEQNKSYKSAGLRCEDYYCFGKPVIAPADGFVTDILDQVDDNEIGQVNTLQNWGNSIVIQHLPGICTQLSHLKKNSIRVKKGDFVKTGDIIAHCGNSGRSPYPHLHFQIQAAPQAGAKTISYPVSYFFSGKNQELKQFSIPEAGELTENLIQQPFLFNAMNILPDNSMCFTYTDSKGTEKTEHWDSYTDALNYKYLYCRETEAVAYYTCDRMMFYFTAFYGNKKSLLYYFFLSAYKIQLTENHISVNDKIPIHLLNSRKLVSSLNDFAAPFYNFVQVNYQSWFTKPDHSLETADIEIRAEISISTPGKNKHYAAATICINKDGINAFSFETGKIKIHAKSKTQ